MLKASPPPPREHSSSTMMPVSASERFWLRSMTIAMEVHNFQIGGNSRHALENSVGRAGLEPATDGL